MDVLELLDPSVRVVSRDPQEPMDLPDHLEPMGVLVPLEWRVLPDHLVQMAHLDPSVHPVLLVHAGLLVLLGSLARMVALVLQGSMDLQVPRVLTDHQVLMAGQELLVPLVRSVLLAAWVRLGPLVRTEAQVPLVRLVHLALQVATEGLELLDPPDQVVVPDLLDHQVPPDLLDHQDNKEQLVLEDLTDLPDSKGHQDHLVPRVLSEPLEELEPQALVPLVRPDHLGHLMEVVAGLVRTSA